MGEFTGSLAVELYDVFHTESAEELGYNHAAHGVYRIDSHSEVCFGNGFGVDEVEAQHRVYVASVVGGVCLFVTEFGDGCECVGVVGSYAQHFLALDVV